MVGVRVGVNVGPGGVLVRVGVRVGVSVGPGGVPLTPKTLTSKKEAQPPLAPVTVMRTKRPAREFGATMRSSLIPVWVLACLSTDMLYVTSSSLSSILYL